MSMVRETDGLVPETPSPMLQPWEVYDRDLFELEMIRVFGRSWVWLGDTEDLQNPGDFLTGRIGAQSVLVVRTAGGEIKGFLNNCRHRASGLLFEPAGHCGSSMTCPQSWPSVTRLFLSNFPLTSFACPRVKKARAFFARSPSRIDSRSSRSCSSRWSRSCP